MNFAQTIYKDEIKHFMQVLVISVIYLGSFLGPLTKVAVLL